MTYTNCTKSLCTHYCGRPGSIDRAMGKPLDCSILCNNHVMTDESEREEVIAEHRKDLWIALQEDTPIRRTLMAMPEDAVLGCFCAPKACHCQTLISAREWMKTQPFWEA